MKRLTTFAVLLSLALGLTPAWAQVTTALPPLADPTVKPGPATPTPVLPMRDVDPQDVVVLDTNKGRIIFMLTPFSAPLAAAQMRILTHQGFYNGRSFFRVVDDFMDQTGDPKDKGTGGSDLPDLPGEFLFRRGAELKFTPVGARNTGLVDVIPVYTQPDAQMAISADGKVPAQAQFCPGVIGMARNSDPNSANSQFFLMRYFSPAGMRLNGAYAAVGRVISGLDVVRAIKTGEPVPDPQDKIITARLLADIPAAERPKVQVVDTANPAYAAYAERVRGEKGLSFTLCDLDTTSPVK